MTFRVLKLNEWVSLSSRKKYEACYVGDDWCVSWACVRLVSFLFRRARHTHINSKSNERKFMNAFVGKILAICKCKKNNDKFMLLKIFTLDSAVGVYGISICPD